MEWTPEDRKMLLYFKDAIDSDNIKIKEKIKQILINNKYIIHVLNNKELEDADAEPDDYFGINILPTYMIHPTQTNVQNFICYEVRYDELDRYNSVVKNLEIIFYVLCEEKNIIDKDTGIARHDLLAALLQDQFNFSNEFGRKIKLISDVPSVVDSDYPCRTLIFKQITDNNLVKTQNGTPILANKVFTTNLGAK